jgi:hypothetical protein
VDEEMMLCHDGLASYAEQPDPVPSVELVFHTFSDQPRLFDAVDSEVPPTATVFTDDAG